MALINAAELIKEKTTPDRRVALVRVTPELILQALRFPEGTRILGIDVDRNFLRLGVKEDLVLKVEADSLPLVMEGDVIPFTHPSWRKVYEEGYRVEFIAWDGWGS